MLNCIVHILIDFYILYARFRPQNYSSHSILPAGVAQFGLATHRNFRLSYEPIVCCVLRLLERIGEYNSETLNVIVDTKLSKLKFDCFNGPF